MAGRSTEIGFAYYSLIPSMDGTTAAINAQLSGIGAAGAQAGQRGGAALGAGIAGGLKAAGGVAIALGALGLLDSVGTYFTEATQRASDLQESANALGVTFGEQADEVSRLGETAAARLGLSRIAFNQLATRFSAFAGTIAGEGGDVIGVIDDLTTRGADFASVFNIDVDEALALFQSGLAGESEPLRRFGLDLSAASVEQFALNNGISDGSRALTEAEKVQARYGLLLEQTAETQGDFARTSDGLANSQRIANAQFEDAQARIGEALLPAAEKFSAWMLAEGVPLVEKLVDLFIKWEPAISATADGVLAYTDTMVGAAMYTADLLAAMEDGVITVDEFKAAFASIPEPLQEAALSVAQFLVNTQAGVQNFFRSGLNGIIGTINGALSALRPIVSFLNDVFGLGLSVPRLASVSLLGSVSSFDVGAMLGGSERRTSGGSFAFAEGAYVPSQRGGVNATVGEGRYDEVVLPLSPAVLQDLGDAISGGHGVDVTIVNADPYVVVDQLEQRLGRTL